jgi:hypothetical protein
VQRAVAAALPGDTVFFPNGVFVITNSIHPKSNLRITGETQTGAIMQYRGTTGASMMDLSGLTSVEVSFLTLDGNTNQNANGIYAYLGSRFDLHHLTIRDFTSTNGPLAIHLNGNSTTGVTDSVIADNVITNMGVNSAWGGGIRCSWNSSRNSILRNTIAWTGRGGIFGDNALDDFQPYSARHLVAGNEFRDGIQRAEHGANGGNEWNAILSAEILNYRYGPCAF